MEPVRNLERLRCGPCCSHRIFASTITADDPYVRMGTQPGFHRRGRAIRQEVKNAMGLQIHDHGAIRFPPAEREIVQANGGWRSAGGKELSLKLATEGRYRSRQLQHLRQTCGSFMGQDDTHRCQGLTKSFGHPSAREDKVRKPLREDPAWAAPLPTEKPPCLEGHQYRVAPTGHIPKGPKIGTMLRC